MATAALSSQDWALALFNKSVLKQAKYAQIVRLLGDTHGRRCLDMGADNGVISLLLRQRGGSWASADLTEAAVASIRSLVESDVHQIDGRRTPFADREFDAVVIVDFLEHIATDQEFLDEAARIMKPGGVLIINVPHKKRWSLINPLRHALGLTDAWHGHLRPGYTRAELTALLGGRFKVLTGRTYSKTFSELVDTALNFGYVIGQRQRGGQASSDKGVVVTQADWQQNAKQMAMLKAAYPLLKLVSWLDRALFFFSGYKLILKAERRG
ncbi:MAG: class I SAM-dependent methyltransferase [Desulfarculus sp.]|jgi:SAM-dependent methyltransferase|nr:MAG: class I SAM-dependent methyltransferase [Desulfarculus sp.]